MKEVFDVVANLFRLVTDNTAAVVFSVIGLLLLIVAMLAILRGLKTDPAEVPAWLKAVLFIALVFGIVFSVAGPSISLLHLADNAIPKTSSSAAFDNLEKNEFARWLIRLIPFDPVLEPHLAVSKLNKLGPEWHKYSFVSPYEELRGLTGNEAVRRVGGLEHQRLSVIIFEIPRGRNIVLHPANARGLLQVVREVERDKSLKIDKPLLEGTNELSQADSIDLDHTEISTWKFEQYAKSYPNYCAITQKFRCDATYSARAHIGDISKDWHPLGFAQTTAEDPCKLRAELCADHDWATWKQNVLSKFGSRAFLVPNLALDSLPRRYLIDFGDPQNQVIPDIGIR